MIFQIGPGRYYISKGTPIPFKCPTCGSLIPYSQSKVVTCWSCGEVGSSEDFDYSWEFVPETIN